MKKVILSIVSLLCFLSAPPALSIDIGIDGFLNRNVYQVDQTVDFFISGFNRDANAAKVDVHVAIIDNSGAIFEYPNWNKNLVPWLASFSIPANFQLPVTLLSNLDNFPGGLKPGSYQLAVAFTTPNTLNLLSFNTRAFKVLSLNNTLTSGGISFGHGQSANNVTAPVASAAAGFRRELPSILMALIEPLLVDIEQCKFAKDFTVDSDLDAGTSLSLSSALTGNIVLNKNISGQKLSYGAFSPSPPESFYQIGQLYTVSGAGGADIPAFNVSATAPKEIIVTQPDLTTFQSIDSSQDLVIRWKGNNGVGEINVSLQGGGSQGSENSHVINCRVADDGELIISSSLLIQLRDKVALATTTIPDIPSIPGVPDIDLTGLLPEAGVNFVFSRTRTEFINNKDEDSTAFFILWAMSLNPTIQ